jgi:hypothetical protein
MAFQQQKWFHGNIHLCGIFQLRLTRVEDLKTAVRDCFNNFKPSTWKMSRRTRGKIKICAENGREHTVNL